MEMMQVPRGVTTAAQIALSEESSDLELVVAHKGGDPNAFQLLVRRNQQRVFSHCRRMVRDPEECADLTQEIFIKVFLNLKTYEPNFAFKTWLYRITANCCIDYLRKKKRQHQEFSLTMNGYKEPANFGAGLEIPDVRFCPEKNFHNHQFDVIFSEAVSKLSDRLRDTFILKEMEGLTNKEIMDVLNCPLNTVKTRMKNAREKLKILLGPHARRDLYA